MRQLHSLSAAAALALIAACARPASQQMSPSVATELAIIPRPATVATTSDAWRVPSTVRVALGANAPSDARALAEHTVALVRDVLKRAAIITDGSTGDVRFEWTPSSTGTNAEAYGLRVASNGVTIAASTGVGAFYALQTLAQVFDEVAGANAPTLRGVSITDEPRFRYRGMHLDVGRHFMPVEAVKRYIDAIARFKFNTFHWHLTEDQGWRIAISKYPRLTEVGSCRKETMVAKNFNPYVGDGKRYCGFYTQDEIRDVVAYAAQRYVTIIPEIELPGHAKAALASYPELACTPGPIEVRTTWGVDEDIFCPSEQTFAFLESVLSEVIALFPGKYIHIGGDEAPKTRWRASPVAQEVMRREGLKNEEELQSYFIRRIEQFLIRNNRRLIGWDEILEGGLAPEATVMSWRGTSGGIAAARERHDVIMTPNSHLYFDFYQGDPRFEPLAIGGFSTIQHVYSYEPVPDVLTAEESRHILGAQANVWTEYLHTPDAVEYMAFPRVLALAEVVWSPRAARDWSSFARRFPNALRTLDRIGVMYRVPHVEGIDSDRLTLDNSATVALTSLLPASQIRYTTDGSDPTTTSALYTQPITVPVGTQGTRITARAFLASGRASPPRSALIRRTTYRTPDAVPAASLRPGVGYAYYEASVNNTTRIDALAAPTRQGTTTLVERRGDERAERYALKFTGYLRVPTDGLYEFSLTSDDGSTMAIGDTVIVNNDGAHGAEERTGMVALRAGPHRVIVRYFQGGGGAALSLRYRVGTGEWKPVPTEWLAHTE